MMEETMNKCKQIIPILLLLLVTSCLQDDRSPIIAEETTITKQGQYWIESWSPDSKEILLKCSYGCERSPSFYARFNIEQQEFVRMLAPAVSGSVAWSPADENIIAVTRYISAKGLFLVDKNGENPQQVLEEDEFAGWKYRLDKGSWSPDGNRMVLPLQEENTSTWDLFVIAPMSQEHTLTRLTTTPEWEIGPVWSPKGAEIAFVAAINEERDIYVIDVSTLVVERLTHSPDVQEAHLTWSPDGNWLAYKQVVNHESQTDSTNSKVFLYNRQSGKTLLFIEEGESLLTLSWSPDGQWIAAVKEHVIPGQIDGDARSIVLFDVATFLEQVEQ